MPSDPTEIPQGGHAAIAALLDSFRPELDSPHSLAVQQAVYLASELQRRANQLQTPQERRQQAELDRMIHNTADKATLTQLTDQAFRSLRAPRAVDQLIHILDVQGVPRFFSPFDRTLLKGFQSFGGYLPGVAAPLVKQKMRRETANVVLPAEREMLTQHLHGRRQEGVRMNVNYLGEALLGERDAQARLAAYLQALQYPEIEVISVKISTIYSQISSLAREHTTDTLSDRLELLFRAAARERYVRADGTDVAKFVYLDMEEYRDKSLTAAAFMRTLNRPGLKNATAGIVLQGYIPDSFLTQQEIVDWARQRVAGGGSPITMRIVKGANMEAERVEASLRGWPQAPYKTKLDTDANYKRMIEFGMRPDNLRAVRLGVASHNLFEVAYALALAVQNNVLRHVQFEMLEGMANHQRRALFELTNNMLLYAPACRKEDFVHAVAYLVRRLDENSGPQNFLRHAFRLRVDSPEWKELERTFLCSFGEIDTLRSNPRRTQDRSQEAGSANSSEQDWRQFVNEPDTDFSLAQNVEWAKQLVNDWSFRCGNDATEIPLIVAGQIQTDRMVKECFDPSRPETVVGRYRQAGQDDVEAAVKTAVDDDDRWRLMSADRRVAMLERVAREIRTSRGELVGAALVDGGKTLTESDPEVSEAVDFVEFYARTARYFQQLPGLESRGKGVVVVVSPWNFPIAIPCGGIAAALAAGNTVILKPASDTVLVAYELCKCFWKAGVSQKTLQLLPGSGRDVGAALVSHPDVNVVILTGGTETALRMLSAVPTLNLLAETGGKNATIVTSMADTDLAIKNVVQSAFGHSGQKCSATSLLILEDEIYNDEEFRRALCDAVESLRVGPTYERHNRIGPLIRPPSGDLERALKELEHGESWAVLPKRVGDNPHIYSPGVKWGVQSDSYTHQTEFFGPVLAVMKARDLHEAIELANATGYGLTSGLESLDDREQELWQHGIRAGNLYINRGTTGAIVLRQPFGGMGKSAFGPGIKAGGPNYVAQLMDFRDVADPSTDETIGDAHLASFITQLSNGLPDVDEQQVQNVIVATHSYAREVREEFGREHDHFRLIGQDNIRRYLPIDHLRIRVHPDDTLFELFARVCAARGSGCRITVSCPENGAFPLVDMLDQLTESWAGAIEFVDESDEELAEVILRRETDRIRYANSDRVPTKIRQAATDVQLFIADWPVMRHGRIELLWYVQEQSLCVDYHRYGNLGIRADEKRADTL